jgi:Leucine-rich repeat (LRR) protein
MASLNDELLSAFLGKESPNEVIMQGQNLSEIGTLKGNYTSVRRLDISFNALQNLRGIDQFPRLRQLSAYCCRLNTLEYVGENTHLVSLLLQQNGISRIPTEFKSLKYLRDLRIDRNQLKAIENISSCIALRTLDISHNNIESLVGLSGLQSLQELKANNNEITSLQPLKALPSIRELQVSHNQLTSLNGLQHLPTLEVIFADHNKIDTVKVPQTYFKQKLANKVVSESSSKVSLQASKQRSSSVSLPKRRFSSTSVGPSPSIAMSEGMDSSTTVLGLLALTEISLTHNQITSLDGLDSLGCK